MRSTSACGTAPPRRAGPCSHEATSRRRDGTARGRTCRRTAPSIDDEQMPSRRTTPTSTGGSGWVLPSRGGRCSHMRHRHGSHDYNHGMTMIVPRIRVVRTHHTHAVQDLSRHGHHACIWQVQPRGARSGGKWWYINPNGERHISRAAAHESFEPTGGGGSGGPAPPKRPNGGGAAPGSGPPQKRPRHEASAADAPTDTPAEALAEALADAPRPWIQPAALVEVQMHEEGLRGSRYGAKVHRVGQASRATSAPFLCTLYPLRPLRPLRPPHPPRPPSAPCAEPRTRRVRGLRLGAHARGTAPRVGEASGLQPHVPSLQPHVPSLQSFVPTLQPHVPSCSPRRDIEGASRAAAATAAAAAARLVDRGAGGRHARALPRGWLVGGAWRCIGLQAGGRCLPPIHGTHLTTALSNRAARHWWSCACRS